MMSSVLVLVILCVSTGSLAAQSLNERINKDELSFMKDEEPVMRRAFERARATLDEFLVRAASPPANTTGYAVKIGIRDGKDTEYFWINEFSVSGDQVSGRINNEPRMVKSVQFGQTYTFSKAQIVDWLYVDRSNRRMYGNFTACALLTKEPPREAAAMRKRFGLECE